MDVNLVDYMGAVGTPLGPETVDGIPGWTILSDHISGQVVNHGATLHGAQRWKIRGKMDTVPATGTTFGLFGDRSNLYCSIRTYDDPRDGLQHWGMALDSTPTGTWPYVQLFTDAVVDALPHTFEFDFTLDMLGTVIIIDGVSYPFVGFVGIDEVHVPEFPPIAGWWDNASIDAFYGTTGCSFLEDAEQDYGYTSDFSNYFDTMGTGPMQAAPDSIGFTVVDVKVYVPLTIVTGTVTSGIDATPVPAATVELRAAPAAGELVGASLGSTITDGAGLYAFDAALIAGSASVAVTSPDVALLDGVRDVVGATADVELTDATWVPVADLPGLAGQWKADAPGTVHESGGHVTGIDDLSVSALDLVTASTDITLGPTQQNGKDVLDFAAPASLGLVAAVPVDPAHVLFAAVWKIRTHNPGKACVLSSSYNAPGEFVNYAGSDGAGEPTLQDLGGTGVSDPSNQTPRDSAHFWLVAAGYDESGADATVRMWRNGLLDGVPSTDVHTFAATAIASIALDTQFNGDPGDGYIAETLAVFAAVSDADRYRLFDYLNHEWAVY